MRYLESYQAGVADTVEVVVWVAVAGGSFERVPDFTTQTTLTKLAGGGVWGDVELLTALHCDGWWIGGAPAK